MQLKSKSVNFFTSRGGQFSKNHYRPRNRKIQRFLFCRDGNGDTAISELSGKELGGRKITVSEAREKSIAPVVTAEITVSEKDLAVHDPEITKAQKNAPFFVNKIPVSPLSAQM